MFIKILIKTRNVIIIKIKTDVILHTISGNRRRREVTKVEYIYGTLIYISVQLPNVVKLYKTNFTGKSIIYLRISGVEYHGSQFL